MSGRGKPAVRPERRLRLAPPEQGCSSPSVVFTGFSAKVTTPSASVLVLRFIWPLCSSIWRLRSWSWLETPLGTTRRPVSSPAICSWRCATTRSWTNSWAEWPSLRAACCPTSRPCCCPRRPRNPPKANKPIQVCFWNPKALLRATHCFF